MCCGDTKRHETKRTPRRTIGMNYWSFPSLTTFGNNSIERLESQSDWLVGQTLGSDSGRCTHNTMGRTTMMMMIGNRESLWIRGTQTNFRMVFQYIQMRTISWAINMVFSCCVRLGPFGCPKEHVQLVPIMSLTFSEAEIFPYCFKLET